jgi:hypothetical protein
MDEEEGMSPNRKPHRLAVFAWVFLLIGFAHAAELSFKLDQPQAFIMDDELSVGAFLTNTGPDAFAVELTTIALEGAKRISPPVMPLVLRGNNGNMPARGRFQSVGGTFEIVAPGKRVFTIKGDALDADGKAHQFSLVVDVVVPDPNAPASIRDPGEQKKEQIFLKARASVQWRPGVWEYTIRNNESESNVVLFDLQEFSVPISAIMVRKPQGWEVLTFESEIVFVTNGKGIPPGQSLGGFELSVPSAPNSVNVVYLLSGMNEQLMEKLEKKQLMDEQLGKLEKQGGGVYFGMIEGPGH